MQEEEEGKEKCFHSILLHVITAVDCDNYVLEVTD
jgi:hypothetical protein